MKDIKQHETTGVKLGGKTGVKPQNNKANNTNKLMLLTKAAAIIGVTKGTLRKAIKNKKIDGYRIGNKIQIYERDLKKYIKSCIMIE